MPYLEGATLFSQQGIRAGVPVALAVELADPGIENALVSNDQWPRGRRLRRWDRSNSWRLAPG
jgi:hypothetical protein